MEEDKLNIFEIIAKNKELERQRKIAKKAQILSDISDLKNEVATMQKTLRDKSEETTEFIVDILEKEQIEKHINGRILNTTTTKGSFTLYVGYPDANINKLSKKCTRCGNEFIPKSICDEYKELRDKYDDIYNRAFSRATSIHSYEDNDFQLILNSLNYPHSILNKTITISYRQFVLEALLKRLKVKSFEDYFSQRYVPNVAVTDLHFNMDSEIKINKVGNILLYFDWEVQKPKRNKHGGFLKKLFSVFN